MTLEALLVAARAGDVRATARLVTIVENEEPEAAALVRATYREAGRALVVGITGPPGGGKSTLVAALVGHYRERHSQVAVIAVDPSSPFTGGALLGDRIRMRERFLDPGVFIRSLASRGATGGLSRGTARVVDLLDALGHEVVLVETVGVGQEEIEVMRVAGTVCLVSVPGLGDDIQAVKAGIIEIADVLVVNKADRPGADQAVADLRAMQSLAAPRVGSWSPPIVRTTASAGDGVADVVDAVARHAAWSRASGDDKRRRGEAARSAVETLLREMLTRRFVEVAGHRERLDDAVAAVADRSTDPETAARDLLG